MTTAAAAVATDRPAHNLQSAKPAGFAGSAMAGAVRWIAAAHTRARTRRVLRSLDERALKDIGLTRSQIDSVESHPRYAPRRTRF